MKWRFLVLGMWIMGLPMAVGAQAASAGIWSGTAGVGVRAVPFELEISGQGANVRGVFVNGPERSASSSGSFDHGRLILHFDYFANTLDATITGGTLTGTYGGHLRPIPLRATRGAAAANAAGGVITAPDIGGDWQVQVKSRKGESAWKLHVRQAGDRAVAAILRIDGDTGNLYGRYRDGVFALSHFNADGPALLVLRPQADGTLAVDQHSKLGVLVAHRPQVARGEGLSGPDDPLRHTGWRDPAQPLAFSFPDLNGKIVANTDRRFQGKVVIVAIGGSWCPNCHDEAPFLEALYRRYHGRGLEIVDLSFEEKDQLANPTRLRAFVQRYGITYPVLLAGEPRQLAATLPEAEHLDCWPTAFFVGRDGRVAAIHAGYAGVASGPDHAALVRETNFTLQRLLAQH